MNLIVGVDGMLGSALLRQFDAEGVPCQGSCKSPLHPPFLSLDLDSPDNWQLPENVSLAFILAGITSTAACESNPHHSRRINVENTIELAKRLSDRGAYILFPSTSTVFDGSLAFPQPSHKTSPVTEYAKQKVEVEEFLTQSIPRSAIVRMTKVVHPEMQFFTKWKEDLTAGREISPFDDKTFSPVDIHFVTKVLVLLGREKLPGIFQISASHQISYSQAAEFLAEKLSVSPGLVKRTSSNANHPEFSTLDTTRVASTFGLMPPDPYESLHCLL